MSHHVEMTPYYGIYAITGHGYKFSMKVAGRHRSKTFYSIKHDDPLKKALEHRYRFLTAHQLLPMAWELPFRTSIDLDRRANSNTGYGRISKCRENGGARVRYAYKVTYRDMHLYWRAKNILFDHATEKDALKKAIRFRDQTATLFAALAYQYNALVREELYGLFLEEAMYRTPLVEERFSYPRQEIAHRNQPMSNISYTLWDRITANYQDRMKDTPIYVPGPLLTEDATTAVA